ncbi:nodulin MtN21 /EamA-like transporter family protein [Arabidopsis thaliana]|uniref:WAT1-related protein n=1 Tax=Arabidopsis thaliana TaxID=3702 RepID=A0A1P8AQM3_ARATH|nr:nodulin MtN21 /EamA-like transporter family protein [Arabidopsis thaliana]ANM58972.1 nodulin MtN21 /EamA-like transporter family protein [Arabidopsis thaliana]|eukprot:NP_001321371.1 nodulin MtN21 /EamA-like transporter family protein [Arabidopsis thaliana]
MGRGLMNSLKPYLAMISMQFGYAGMYIITMVSLKHGMNHYVLAVYRHAIATAVIAPFALFHERKIRPKMTFRIFLQIALLGFIEPVLDQNLYYVGMTYTSATFASATANVLPAITFVLAIIFRLESVNFKKVRSIAKVVGTVITVSGALLMTLYKGPIVDFIRFGGGGGGGSDGAGGSHGGAGAAAMDKHWIPGTLMLLGRTFGWAGFFILQSFTLKQYPAELSLTTLICLMGTLEGTAVSLVTVRDLSAWKIGFDSNLFAAAYSGVICSGVAYYVQGVVMRERGPVFVATFNPLCVVITAALGVVVLSESIHLGRYLFLLSKISIKFLDPFFFLSNKLCINLKPQKR